MLLMKALHDFDRIFCTAYIIINYDLVHRVGGWVGAAWGCCG